MVNEMKLVVVVNDGVLLKCVSKKEVEKLTSFLFICSVVQ